MTNALMQVVPFLLTRLRAEHEAELQRRLAEMKSKHEQELEHTVTRDRSEAPSSCQPSRAACATCPASGTLNVDILMYMYLHVGMGVHVHIGTKVREKRVLTAMYGSVY